MNHTAPMALCCTMLLLALPFNAGSSDEERMKIELGKHRLSVPKKNLLEPFLSRMNENPGRKVSEFTMALTSEDIASEVEGYPKHEGDRKLYVWAHISVVGEDAQRSHSGQGQYSDIWYGHGYYDRRIIERHEMSDFYKMRRKGDKKTWEILRVHPDSEKPMPNPLSFWVASCRLALPSPLGQTSDQVFCRTTFLHDDLMFYSSLNETNLRFVDAIRALFIQRFLSWKVPQ